jgi:glycerol-3-phosphate O-acyltransferase
VVWTDDAGKLDYDSALEDLVRDARVILSREVRHSILKITPGSEKAPVVGDAVNAPETPAPNDALPDDAVTGLHQRHVDAERHEHEQPPGDEQPGVPPDVERARGDSGG